MDNFHIDVVSNGNLAEALKIAFRNYKAKGYQISPEFGLVFFWHADPQPLVTHTFPFEMDAEGAADFAKRWLAEADYGKKPDHDGDNGKGWQVYTTSWGHVDCSPYSICAVKPRWAMYGK